MIPLNIITGFLGSGKTTFLKNLLPIYKNRRIAIIQNEFAPTGVDGRELKQVAPDIQLVEINNGSVFCMCQLSNFTTTLLEIIEKYNPEEVFLETSGMADPINITEVISTEILAHQVYLNRIYTIIDVRNFFRGLKLMERFRHQIMVADVIILNKTDLNPKNTEDILEEVKKINPFANQHLTSYCQLKPEVFTPAFVMDNMALRGKLPKAGGRPTELSTCVLKTHTTISLSGLKQFVEHYQKECPRIKGLVNLTDQTSIVFHSVFDEFNYEVLPDYSGPCEIILFGKNITPREAKKQYEGLAKQN